MVIVIVDDEIAALENLWRVTKEACEDAVIKKFDDTKQALDYIRGSPADVVFMDIEMPEINGLELAKLAKEAHPDINIIFVTAYSQYAVDAVSLRCSGYLLKPVRLHALKMELENLRFPIKSSMARIRVQTFGNFEIFVDNQPISFKRAKSKEALAYLIDRKGAAVTTVELASILFEDKEYNRSIQNQTQIYISDMLRIFTGCKSAEYSQ